MTSKAKQRYDDARDDLFALDMAFASMSFSSVGVDLGNKKKRKPQLRSVDDDWGGG